MRLVNSLRFLAVLALSAAALAAPQRAGAADLRLTIANDPVAGSSRPDDLYTSAVGIEMTFDRARVAFGERMFTDRERGLRFDETHLAVGMDLPELAGWEGEAFAGVLRVGRGLLGESAQNAVHDWIGSGRVDLPYIRGDHDYATLEASFARPAGRLGRLHLSSEIDAFTAPGFRSWLRGGLFAERPLGRSAALRAGLGARADLVEASWLGDRVDDLAPTAELAASWEALVLRWSWNDFGDRRSHLTLGVRVGR